MLNYAFIHMDIGFTSSPDTKCQYCIMSANMTALDGACLKNYICSPILERNVLSLFVSVYGNTYPHQVHTESLVKVWIMLLLECLYTLHLTVRNVDITTVSRWYIKGASAQYEHSCRPCYTPLSLWKAVSILYVRFSQLKLHPVPVMSRYSTGSAFVSFF